jgi:hypothetical protein
MSKSAVYAGLGQGLMALGQGAGRALETISLEKLRQQNFEQNWAREDKIRQEQNQARQSERSQDLSMRQAERKEDNAFKQQQINATNTNNTALMELKRDQFTNETENQVFTQARVTRDGENFMQEINKDGTVVREQLIPAAQEKLSEASKLQYKQAEGELNTLIEYGDGDSARAMELRTKMDNLLGVKSTEEISTVDGLTADQVIAKFMEANPTMTKEQARRLAKQQGRIQ